MTWERVPKSGPPADGSNGQARTRVDPQLEAARALRGADGPASAPRKTSPPSPSKTGNGVGAFPAGPPVRADASMPPRGASALRFRDWNPDLRVARELGVRIEYSAAGNEIRCPDLMFSSRDREIAGGRAPHLTSRGIVYGPATSVGGDGSDRTSSGPGPYGSAGPSGPGGAAGSSGPPASAGSPDRPAGSSGSGETRGGGGEKIKN